MAKAKTVAKLADETNSTTSSIIPETPDVTPDVLVQPLEEEVKQPEAVTKAEEIKAIIPREEPAKRPESDSSLPFDQRIKAFLQGRHNGQYIQVNDFLKSLYGLPVPGALPEWRTQQASKFLRHILDQMILAREIQVNNNQHKMLGTIYYKGEDAVTQYRNIGDVVIQAKIFG